MVSFRRFPFHPMPTSCIRNRIRRLGFVSLYGQRIDGQEPATSLSAEPGLDDTADYTISTDSAHVLFTSDANPQGLIKLYARPIDGTDSRKQLSKSGDGEVYGFTVSPKGHVLYFADDDKSRVYELYVLDLNQSQNPVKLNGQLTRGGYVYGAQLSDDERWVVYTADQERKDVVRIVFGSVRRSRTRRAQMAVCRQRNGVQSRDRARWDAVLRWGRWSLCC
jgi:Tol biopolymer transport system component